MVDLDIIDLASFEIPKLSYTLSAHPLPPSDIVEIGQKIDSADGIIFLSPEYNGGYSSILKNTIDYFPKTHYARKPIGIVSVSAGALAGMRGALQMQHLALALWAIPSPTMLLVPKVKEKFDAEGNLLDGSFGNQLDKFISDYLWLAEAIIKQKELDT